MQIVTSSRTRGLSNEQKRVPRDSSLHREIERQLQDIQSTLSSDPDYQEAIHTYRKKIGKKGSRRLSREQLDENARREAAERGRCPLLGQRRKPKAEHDWKDEDPWKPGKRFKDSNRKPSYVIINLPAKQHRRVSRERIPVPVGEKWVHAGCNVFVRRDVYRCFTRVRDALAKQMNATFQGNWND